MYPFTLQGKNIIITGASQGIGKQCALVCSDLGANVILLARNMKRLSEVHNSLKPANHLCFSIDLVQYDQLEPIIQQAVHAAGKIWGIVHSAGLEMTLPLRNMQAEHYHKLFAVNSVAGFELARIVSKNKYLADAGGSFVFIASIMGILGQAGKIGYCSSKGALIAGVKAMALELAAKKVRVNSISPALVETEMAHKIFDGISDEAKDAILEMHPLGLGKPEDVAYACAFLLSEASRWITGSNLVLDGGYSTR